MKFNESLAGARGQIVWIFALALSTAAIIQLERLDIGAPKATSRQPVHVTDANLAAQATEALAEAQSRLTDAPDDPAFAASLLLALSGAVQAGALEPAEGRARADALWDKAAEAGPAWRPGIVVAALTFAP